MTDIYGHTSTINPAIQKLEHPSLTRLHLYSTEGFEYNYTSWYALTSSNSLDLEYGRLKYTYDLALLLGVL